MLTRGWIVIMTTALIGVACSGPSKPVELARYEVDTKKPAQPITGATLYKPGEYLAWKVKWKALSGGSGRLIVGQPGTKKGHRALVIRSVMQTEGLVAVFKHLRDELTTTVDLDSGKPTRSYNSIESGKRRRSLETSYEAGKVSFEHREAGKTERGENTASGDSWVLDLHTTLAHLRAWKADAGSRGYLFAQSQKTLFRVELAPAGVEKIETPAGTFTAVRYEGVAQEIKPDGSNGEIRRQLRLWISDDELRLPVKLTGETEYGDVDAILVEYR